jgi:hypothetical protein
MWQGKLERLHGEVAARTSHDVQRHRECYRRWREEREEQLDRTGHLKAMAEKEQEATWNQRKHVEEREVRRLKPATRPDIPEILQQCTRV